MTAYIAATVSLTHVAIPVTTIAAAATLVMLAASIPISLAGWGLREVSAVYALGYIGVPNGVSLVTAILVGITSLLVNGGLALTVSYLPSRMRAPPGSAAALSQTAQCASFLSWFLPLFAASAVFFQIYVPVGVDRLNVNLADSVTLFAGAVFVLRRGSLSNWRMPHLGLFAALMTVAITLAFVHGLFVAGWTSWGFTNRFFGWLVVLSYVATGALLVSEAGQDGLIVLLRTFVVSGLAIAGLEMFLVTVQSAGIPVSPDILAVRIEGFAQNPNAFAFQLLLVISAIMALRQGFRGAVFALALAFLGLIWTGSRAGLGACAILCTAAVALQCISVRQLMSSLLLTLMLAGFIVAVSYALSGHEPRLLANVAVSDSVSDTERWRSLTLAWQMFKEHPLFGAGLGVFIAEFRRADGIGLVIHSTPMWLLAEVGLAGFAIFAAPYFFVLASELKSYRDENSDVSRRLAVLSLIVFGVMCQAHELLYQRTLWLVLGAALACKPVLVRSRASAVADDDRRTMTAIPNPVTAEPGP